MTKRLIGGAFFLLLLFFGAVLPAYAGTAEYRQGEAVFAARYDEYGSLRDTGLRLGTASWSGASFSLSGEGLLVSAASDYKTYLLLPPELPFPDTYTVLYTFRFTELLEANGSCGFLLTSSGAAPSNRTEAVLRADGVCDGFGRCGEAVTEHLTSGAWVTVEIPIRHGMLSELRVRAGGEEEVLRLQHVRSVAEGGRGFVFRNASVEIGSVYLVCGADFTEEEAAARERAVSYLAPEDFTGDLPPAPEDDVPAPHTADAGLYPAALCAAAAAAVYRLTRKRKT